ncbi:hypothetical protein TELCIR_21938 [Teladorsagia circumcincta]|uniref:Serpin domain-containing protein n=1 Tax=Teladorsagia circumcincta TaxID=45464 RepID=A0A2G9TGL2_TELCI|nr:hypothetical protein TELCIR_21938 [Teladorsagia circumcincta]
MDLGFNIIRYAPVNESIILSPVSVIFALAMIQVGAKGTTKSQISSNIFGGAVGATDQATEDYYANLYGKLQNASDGVKTNIANGFFLNKRYFVKKDYEQKIKKKYGAKVQALDFEKAYGAVEAINGYVDRHTYGKIHELVTINSIKGMFYSMVTG